MRMPMRPRRLDLHWILKGWMGGWRTQCHLVCRRGIPYLVRFVDIYVLCMWRQWTKWIQRMRRCWHDMQRRWGDGVIYPNRLVAGSRGRRLPPLRYWYASTIKWVSYWIQVGVICELSECCCGGWVEFGIGRGLQLEEHLWGLCVQLLYPISGVTGSRLLWIWRRRRGRG